MSEEKVWDTRTIRVSISATAELGEGQEVYYWLHESEKMGSGWVVVHEAEVMIPRPTAEKMRPVQVAAFREAIQKTRAEAESTVRQLEEQLENLLAISYTPGVVTTIDDDTPF